MRQNINQNIGVRKPKQVFEDTESLLSGLKNGDLVSISKALTLIENKNYLYSEELFLFLSKLETNKKTLRIAISGPPGVGKSTFIEALGLELISAGKKIAVLAIDPSSELNKGSILGDKTRMDRLSTNENAFIRPSSNSLESGGVRSTTYDAIMICEAAGFDIVLVETVGVGQSEIDASKITDLFLLLLAPAGGDELQGIKKGIVELADMILINKADSGLETLAQQAQKDYKNAVHLNRQSTSLWQEVRVKAISSLENIGIKEVAHDIISLSDDESIYAKIQTRRKTQQKKMFSTKAQSLLLNLLSKNENFKKSVAKLHDSPDIYQALTTIRSEFEKYIQ